MEHILGADHRSGVELRDSRGHKLLPVDLIDQHIAITFGLFENGMCEGDEESVKLLIAQLEGETFQNRRFQAFLGRSLDPAPKDLRLNRLFACQPPFSHVCSA